MRTENTTLVPRNLTKKSRGLIRSLNRSFVRDDKSPQVVRKTVQPKEPTVCARCGAVFLHKTWRHDHNLTEELLEQRQWGFLPRLRTGKPPGGPGPANHPRKWAGQKPRPHP
jgi:hypothetical protein